MFQGIVIKCAADLDRAMPVLEGLRKQITECQTSIIYTRPAV
jgi:hypothetical protein